MNPKVNYGTVMEALHDFRSKGFLIDFNLEENCIACAQGKFHENDFRIIEIYR
jgi:hypothetical protein